MSQPPAYGPDTEPQRPVYLQDLAHSDVYQSPDSLYASETCPTDELVGRASTISPADNPDSEHARPSRKPFSIPAIRQLVLDLALTAPAIAFLVYGAMVLRNDGLPIGQNPIPALRTASAYGPTLFPIAFAAIAANLLKSAASWKLERGISILSLEYLLSCRTVFSTLTTPFSIRAFSRLVPLLFLLWLLSPLGGQAALRALDVVPSKSIEPWPFRYLEFLSKFTHGGWPDSNGIGLLPVIHSVFISALSSPRDVKAGPRDLFGNLKIPMIEPYQRSNAQTNGDGWYVVTSGEHNSETVWSSLLGIPISAPGGLAQGQNYTFLMETSYINANCSVRGASPSPAYKSPDVTNNNNNKTDARRTDFIQPHNHGSRLPMQPLELSFFSYSPTAITNATCVLTTSHVEADVACQGLTCSVRLMRPLQRPLNVTALTVLDGITVSSIDPYRSSRGSARLYTIMETFRMISLSPWHHLWGKSQTPFTPIETYLVNPDSPYAFSGLGSWDRLHIYPIGDQVFSQRLSQLLNSYWLASIAPYNITGNFQFEARKQWMDLYMVQQNVTGTKRPDQLAMQANKTWLFVLFLASSVMLVSGIAASVLGCLRRGPDVLDSFSFFLRDSPYVTMHAQNSMQDAKENIKLIKDIRVCIGDTQSTEDKGFVSLGTADNVVPLSRQKPARLYI